MEVFLFFEILPTCYECSWRLLPFGQKYSRNHTDLWQEKLFIQAPIKKKRQSHTPVIYIPPPPPLPPELKRALWVKTAQVAMEHPQEAEPAVWVPDHMLTLIKGKRERKRTICNVIISKTWFQSYPSDHMTLQVTMFLRSFHPIM